VSFQRWQNATAAIAYGGSGDPTGDAPPVKQTYAAVTANASTRA